jgi:predicted SAM-dependent methyltransferase
MTPAVDFTCDANILPFAEGSVDCIYSNAFFEHIYRLKRVPHLQSAFRCLDEKTGFVCYTGLPYFKNIAKLYLEKGPGTAGPVFDLFNVYRYTHGDPDRVPSWYLDQLHKSLFDEDELSGVLRQSGFKNFVMFTYAFPGDTNQVSVTMGFFTTKTDKTQEQLKEECLNFIKQFDDRYLILRTLQFIN